MISLPKLETPQIVDLSLSTVPESVWSHKIYVDRLRQALLTYQDVHEMNHIVLSVTVLRSMY